MLALKKTIKAKVFYKIQQKMVKDTADRNFAPFLAPPTPTLKRPLDMKRTPQMYKITKVRTSGTFFPRSQSQVENNKREGSRSFKYEKPDFLKPWLEEKANERQVREMEVLD